MPDSPPPAVHGLAGRLTHPILADLSGVELRLPADFSAAIGQPTLTLDHEQDPWPFDPAKRLDVRHRIIADLWPLAVPLVELRPLPGNPRKGDVEAMRLSLRTYGQRKPVVVNVDSDAPTIEAGNTTRAAAAKERWTHLAIVRVRDDPTTQTGYAVADNRLGQLGEFDLQLLADATSRLQAADPALLLASGYSPGDWGDLMEAAGHAREGVVEDPQGEWQGMPDYDNDDLRARFRLIVNAPTEEDGRKLLALLGRSYPGELPRRVELWWPTSDGYRGSDSSVAYRAVDPEGLADDAT